MFLSNKVCEHHHRLLCTERKGNHNTQRKLHYGVGGVLQAWRVAP